MTPRVTQVHFMPAEPGLRRTGLWGWVSCLLDGRYKVEGLTVRRTAPGRFTISFPFRDDGWGRRWHYLHPIDEPTRSAIEAQVLAQVDLDSRAQR